MPGGYPPKVSLSGSKSFVLFRLEVALPFRRLKTKNLGVMYRKIKNLGFLLLAQIKGCTQRLLGAAFLKHLYLRLAD
jgi:hypothetical protein